MLTTLLILLSNVPVEVIISQYIMARHQTATVYMCMWVCLKMGDSLNIWINIAILMKTMMIKHQMKSLFSSSFVLLHTHACPLRCDAPDAH